MVRAIIGIAVVFLFIFLVDRFCNFAMKWEKEQRERDKEALIDAGRSSEEIAAIMDGNSPDESRMGMLS